MKLHIPARLRACLLAAITAVSALQYNATAAGVATTETELIPPQLGSDSSYTLSKISGAIPSDKITIVKYLYDTSSGTYTSLNYTLNFATQGESDGTATHTFYWDNAAREFTTTGTGPAYLTAKTSRTTRISQDDTTVSPITNITGSFVSNSVPQYGKGAGIENSGVNITSIVADFIGNLATQSSNGGAFYNHYATITTLTGNFIGNAASGTGGAIYNVTASNIKTLTGDFIGNRALYGGAIGCSDNGRIEILNGDFINNTAGYRGGAIYNSAALEIITADFFNNKAADGGAIYNERWIMSLTGDLIGNTARDTAGAIYNELTIDAITGNFFANSAGEGGGAILNFAGKIGLLAMSGDVNFVGNRANTSSTMEFNAIANNSDNNKVASINLNSYGTHRITVNDSITGISGKTDLQVLNINNGLDGGNDPISNTSNLDFSSVEFNSLVSNQTINVHAGTLVLGSFSGTTLALADASTLAVSSTEAQLENVILNILDGATVDARLGVIENSTFTLTNGGTINIDLTGRNLTQALSSFTTSLTGTVTFSGSASSDASLIDKTYNLKTGETLTLTGGTLTSLVTGAGTLAIGGAVSSNAAYIDAATNSVLAGHTLTLTDGTLLEAVSGAGTLAIAADAAVAINSAVTTNAITGGKGSTLTLGATGSLSNYNGAMLEMVGGSSVTNNVTLTDDLTTSGTGISHIGGSLNAADANITTAALHVSSYAELMGNLNSAADTTIDGFLAASNAYVTAGTLTVGSNAIVDFLFDVKGTGTLVDIGTDLRADTVLVSDGSKLEVGNRIVADVLTLDTNAKVEADSLAANNITIGSGASLTVNKADIQLAGNFILQSTGRLTANLTGAHDVLIQNGATLTGTVDMNGNLVMSTMDNIATITGAVTGNILSANLNNASLNTNLTVLGTTTLAGSVSIGATNTLTTDSLILNGVNFDGNLVTNNALTIAGGVNTVSGTLVLGSLKTLSLTGGSLDVTGGITGGATAPTEITHLSVANGAVMKTDVTLTGAGATLTVLHGTTAAVTGFETALLMGATTGALSGGDITASASSSINSIANAASVKLISTIVTNNVTMTGTLSMSDNARVNGSVTGATGTTLADSIITDTLNNTGTLSMENSGIATLDGTQTIVTMKDNSYINSDFTMTNRLSMSGGSIINGDITGASSAQLTDSNIFGILNNTGNLSMVDSGISTLTGTQGLVSMKDKSYINSGFSMDESLHMSGGSTVRGTITGAFGAQLADSSIIGTLNNVGSLNMDNSSITTLTGTQTDVMMKEKSDIASNITMSRTLTMADSSAINITGFSGTTNSITNSNTGALTGKDTSTVLSISASTIKGDITTIGTLSVTGGSVMANIGADAASITTVTLTGTTVTGSVWATNLTTYGDVLIGGSLGDIDQRVQSLSILHGELEVAGDAYIHDLSYTNGSLTVGGVLNTTGETSYVNVVGTAMGIVHTGDYNMQSTSLIVTGAVDINAAAPMTGELTLDNSSLTVKGQTGAADIAGTVDVDGLITLQNKSTLSVSDKLTSAGLTASTGSSIILSKGAELSNSALNLDNSDLTSLAAMTGITDMSIKNSSTLSATGQNLRMNGALSITDSTVDANLGGSISDATVKNAHLTSTDLSVSNAAGNASITVENATIDSKLTANDAEGSITIKDSTVTGALSATGTGTGSKIEITDSSINGGITAENMETWGQVNVAGDVDIAKDLTINIGELNADGYTVEVDGTLTFNEGTIVAESVTAGTTVYTNAQVSVKDGDQVTNGELTLNGGSLTITNGNLDVNNDAASSEMGNLSMYGNDLDLDMAGASITIQNNAKIIDSSIDAMNGGSMTIEEGNLSVEDSIIDLAGGALNVTTGDANLDGADINAAVTVGGSTTIKDENKLASLVTAGLSVDNNASLSSDASITARGHIDIKGLVTAETGDIILNATGVDSSITADVTAQAGSLTLTGSELKMSDATLKAADIIIDTTLNAGAGSILDGAVTGDGSIVKTGGDLLDLKMATMTGSVSIKDNSQLSLSTGADLATLSLDGGTTLYVADVARGSINGNVIDTDTVFDSSKLGSISAGSMTIGAASGSTTGKQASILSFDMDLAQVAAGAAATSTAVDTITLDTLTVGEEGAVISLRQHDITDEALIDTETQVDLITTTAGITATDGQISEVIDHDFDTLNAHAITDTATGKVYLHLSENFKGAEGSTNQEATAGALTDINGNDVKGTQLGNILTALGQTRSEADALSALDSLSGRGHAGLNKLVIEGSMNHLQTLRNTQKALNAGLVMNYDITNGQSINDDPSRAISIQYTGGNADLSDDGNGGTFNTTRQGFILVGAQKVTREWTIGYDFAYSHETGRSAEVDVTSDSFYADINATHTSRRLSQYFSLGAAMYGLDTARDIYVSAPGFSQYGRAKGTTTAAMLNLSYEATYDFRPRESRHNYSGVAVVDASFGTVDGFQEKGFGNAGLDVSYDDITNVTIGAGMRYTYNYELCGKAGFISADALFVVNAGNTDLSVTNRFIGGGTGFQQTGTESGRGGLRLNASGVLPITERWSAVGQVNSEFRPDESSYSGSVGVKFAF